MVLREMIKRKSSPVAADPNPRGAQRLPKEFTDFLSHELRTPLSSIIGFAEAMADDPTLTEERYREFAQIIVREGKRLSRVVEALMVHSTLRNPATPGKSSLV